MSENTEHTDWINDYPVLSNQSKENPFRVPDLYFEDQQERLHSAIFAEDLKLKVPTAIFDVPENYFENLTNQIISVVKLEEMRAQQEPLTKSNAFFEEQQNIIAARVKINEFAEKGRGFTVPKNYFEELTDRINQKTGIKTVQQTGKVRSLFTRAAWKYATAACIAVAITTGVFVKKYQAAHNVQTQLSNLPDEDIENYLDIHADSYDNHLILETSAASDGSNSDKDKTGTDSNILIKK